MKSKKRSSVLISTMSLLAAATIFGADVALGKPPQAPLVRFVETEKQLNNLDKKGVALGGYDPVAYFNANQAVKGDDTITAEHGGAVYRFSSQQNREMFEQSPQKYIPAFGGYCGYGVSKGKLAPVDPTAFQIIDGRLVLQYSHKVLKMFNKDASGNLTKADTNWPKLLDEHGK